MIKIHGASTGTTSFKGIETPTPPTTEEGKGCPLRTKK
jgi:hypothetical protein